MGHGWWLFIYLGCGVIGQIFGYLWEPPDAGASVAGAGLLGAMSAWLLSPAGPRQLQIRVWGVLWPLVGIALTPSQISTARRWWPASPWARYCCGGTGAIRWRVDRPPQPVARGDEMARSRSSATD